ncbi:MAG: isopentenyl-diphosphate Delta-isomerase [Fluviicola sp.]|jgi:isopentenyl-diphosphate delta-isomerase
MELLILVDENDQEIGSMEKMEVHEKGLLHRAFSILIFNSKNEMLLQQRALSKYHSGGLWTNTCCSHPRKEESTLQAANRRLIEEMGFSTELEEKFSFIYRAELDKNMIEHELDHVFFGTFEGEFQFNREEVNAIRWISISDLIQEIKDSPSSFTEWFKILMNEYLDKLTLKSN